MTKIDKKSITILNLETTIKTLIYLAVVSLIFYFLNEYSLITKVYYLSLIVAPLYIIEALCLNPLYYKHHQFKINEKIMYITKGKLSVREATIPLYRIQHVDVEQSFISRFFNLYQLKIYTAGDKHTIAYVEQDVANDLKDKIVLFLVNVGADTNE
ncbi:PH domain-containing protein [[Brevibacterium] frigoritolerans]|nr:PH domain-containing protein [Peribacillus frigoritolerans]